VTSSELPEVEDVIRMNLITEMIMCEPVAGDTNRTFFQLISLVDLKGSIPASLVNSMLARRAAYFDMLKEYIEANLPA
jgi:hypothetical protein